MQRQHLIRNRTGIFVSLAIAAALVTPIVLATHGGPGGESWGAGHINLGAWVPNGPPPVLESTGTGNLTTNLVAYGDAIGFSMPVPAMTLKIPPAGSPFPVRGKLVLDVPPATDIWWTYYPGPVIPNVTTGGTIELDLVGNSEFHPFAINVFGTYTISGATGQYAGLIGTGDWSGSVTGGSGPYGPFLDFAVMGQYA